MDRADVIILGGGLVGLALAAALDSSGLSSIVVDPADPDMRQTQAFDGRTSALSSSSKRMFDTIGISDHFPVPGCPIRRIEVADGLGDDRVTRRASRDPLDRRTLDTAEKSMRRPVRRVHRKSRTHLSFGLVHLVLSDVQVRQVEAHGRGVGKERNRLAVVVDRA